MQLEHNRSHHHCLLLSKMQEEHSHSLHHRHLLPRMVQKHSHSLHRCHYHLLLSMLRYWSIIVSFIISIWTRPSLLKSNNLESTWHCIYIWNMIVYFVYLSLIWKNVINRLSWCYTLESIQNQQTWLCRQMMDRLRKSTDYLN